MVGIKTDCDGDESCIEQQGTFQRELNSTQYLSPHHLKLVIVNSEINVHISFVFQGRRKQFSQHHLVKIVEKTRPMLTMMLKKRSICIVERVPRQLRGPPAMETIFEFGADEEETAAVPFHTGSGCKSATNWKFEHHDQEAPMETDDTAPMETDDMAPMETDDMETETERCNGFGTTPRGAGRSISQRLLLLLLQPS